MTRNGRARFAMLARPAWAALAGTVMALAVAGARPAAAEEAAADGAPAPISLVDAHAAPFSAAELTQAVLARLLPAATDAPSVRVSPAGAGTVSVQVGDRSRVVVLGDRTGAGAARVVALVIAELASGAPAPGDPAGADDDARAAAPTVTVAGASDVSSTVPSVERVAVAAPDAGPAKRLSVTAGALKGTGTEELLAGTVDADVAFPIGTGGLRLVPSAGAIFSPTRNAGTFDEVSYWAAVVRLLGGRSWRLFDLLAGPFIEPYRIGGANPHGDVLVGAEALARVTVPLSRHVRVTVAARADAYANRVRVLFVDDGAYATPRLALGLGAGAAWDWPW